LACHSSHVTCHRQENTKPKALNHEEAQNYGRGKSSKGKIAA